MFWNLRLDRGTLIKRSSVGQGNQVSTWLESYYYRRIKYSCNITLEFKPETLVVD